MHAYVALPLVAALIAVGCGAAIAAMSPRERANQLGALLMGSVAFWAGCEILWNTAADADSALAWHRIAAPGFLFLGAHGVCFLNSLQDGGLPRVRRALPLVYGANVVFLILTWSGHGILREMVRTSWGWSLVPGPLLMVWFAFTAAVVGLGLVEWVRAFSAAGDALDGRYAVRVGLGVALAAAVAGASDVLLPGLGLRLPRVGSLAISLVGLAGASALGRLGFSPLNAAGLARHMLHILPDGVALVQPSGRIRVSNPHLRELLDAGPGPVDGRLLTDHLALPLEPGVEHRARECELAQASGRLIPVSVSTVAVRTEAGQPRGVLVILRDLREVVGLRRRLATSERLAAVGQLASGIAHEINNPLAFVRSNLHHLQRESAMLAKQPPGDRAAGVEAFAVEADEVIRESLDGVARALRVVRDVNDFSHGGGDERQPLALAEAVEQAVRVVRMGLPPAVRVEPACDPGAEVHGSPRRLKQLFLNLLVNAVRAVGESGRIAIDVRREGDRVVATVADDGVGIASADLARVFDPFFVAQPSEPGAGLGLAVCHEIVRSHGGWIEADSQPGQGTRVRVSLPAWHRGSSAGASPA